MWRMTEWDMDVSRLDFVSSLWERSATASTLLPVRSCLSGGPPLKEAMLLGIGVSKIAWGEHMFKQDRCQCLKKSGRLQALTSNMSLTLEVAPQHP